MADIDYIRKRGRSLIILSSGIILYILAGGIFTDEGSFVFGVVKFEHPEILEYAIIVIFIYFYFRFYLSNKNNWNAVKRNVLDKLKGDTKFRRYANNEAQKYVTSLIEGGNDIGGKKFHHLSKSEWPDAEIFDRHHTPIEIERFKRSVVIKAVLRNSRITDYAIDLDWWKFNYHYLRAWVKYIRNNEDFWDKVFPYLISYGAMVALIYETVERLDFPTS